MPGVFAVSFVVEGALIYMAHRTDWAFSPKVQRLLLWTGILLAAAATCFRIVVNVRVMFARLTFPLDLEWMEGGVLVHAYRLAHGQGIYVPPSVEFIPFLYTPLYPATLAALSWLFPLGYTLGRLVSLVSVGGACLCLVLACRGEVEGAAARAGAWLVGLVAAGAVFAAFAFTGHFYDLVRADSYLLLLEAWALWFALRGAGWRTAALASALIALAFLAKQTAIIVGVGIGLGLLLTNWRRALVYGGASALLVGGAVGLLTAVTDGWFWTYVFQLHQTHAFRWDLAFRTGAKLLLLHDWPIGAALAASTLGLAMARHLRRTDLLLCAVAVAGFVAALVGFGTQWAYFNAFIPGIFFPCFAAALLTARLLLLAAPSRRSTVLAVGAVLLLGWQSLHSPAPHASAAPTAEQRAAAQRLLVTLKDLPGPLFIPRHPFYGRLAGKETYVHAMGIADVEAKLGKPTWLWQAIRDGYFAGIVLDRLPRPGQWGGELMRRYAVARWLEPGKDTVGTFTGEPAEPRIILQRRTGPGGAPGS